MKTFNSIVKTIAVLCITGALFFSCSVNDTDEYGTLVIKLPGSARAAVSNDFIKTLSYRIECSNDAEEKKANHDARSSGDSVSISLAPGAWAVTLTVLNAADQEISDKHTTTVLIEGGKTNTAEFRNVQIDTSRNDVSGFKITKPVSADGKIDGNNITITIPEGTKLDNMSFSVIHTGVSIKHEPDDSKLNFEKNESYTFTVTAENKNTKTYTVMVTTGEGPGDNLGYMGETLSFIGQVYGGESNKNDPTKPYNHDAEVYTEGETGGKGAITKGKLNFTIGTPAKLQPLFANEGEEMNNMYSNLKLNPGGANSAPLNLWAISQESNNNYVLRKKNTTTNTILQTTITENVEYLYVDRDVTITAKGKEFTDKDISVITSDLNLKLRKGWNAIYRIDTTTIILGKSLSTINISLGNPELKWVLELDEDHEFAPSPNPSPSKIIDINVNEWSDFMSLSVGEVHRYNFNAQANKRYWVYWIDTTKKINVSVRNNSSYIIESTSGTTWTVLDLVIGKYLNFTQGSSSGNVIIEVQGSGEYAICLSTSADPDLPWQ